MKFNNTPNKSYTTTDGEVKWHSRSVAVCAAICTKDRKIIVTKRSDKVDHAGEWCLPCGYIDWDETIREAVYREVYEEVGIDITSASVVDRYSVVDSPNKDAKQNITFHFWIMLPALHTDLLNEIKLCDESTEFDFIDLVNPEFGDKQFAFNHDKRIKMLSGTHQ